MSTKCMMSRMSLRWSAPVAFLALGLLGAGCRNESEKAEGAVREQAKEVHDQAKEVREQVGKVKEERRELGSDVRELQQREHDAWTQWAKSSGLQVESNPDGSVTLTKPQPPTGTPPPDDTLRQALTSKLSSNDRPVLKGVVPTVNNGVVTLRGSVPTMTDATVAADEALKTEGVSKVIVHLNYGG